jgi:tetratricopeptide (TPR) repeat protein
MGGRRSGDMGRSLLSSRNRLRSEKDPERRRRLYRRQIRLLVGLGNMEEARKACRELLDENPRWPGSYSIMADLECRIGDWSSAEELFESAAAMHEGSGDAAAAKRLRMGPLYRLAEARGDHARCLDLASGPETLSTVLRARALRRRSESLQDFDAEPVGWLEEKLVILENAWRGKQVEEMAGIAEEWQNTEPEWRWRFIVEGVDIWNRKGLDARPWRGPIKATVCPVLDPRFHVEWKNLRI